MTAFSGRYWAIQQHRYEVVAATGGFSASPVAERLAFRSRHEARQFLLQLDSRQRLPIALSKLHSGQRINAVADDLCAGRLRVIVHQPPVRAVTVELDASDAARQSLLRKTQATLQKIIAEQDRETRTIAKEYDQQSVLAKAGMHAGGIAEGFVEAGAAFLTWVGDVHDVVDMQKRMMRGASAAMQSYRGADFSFSDFQGRLMQAEYKEIVEVLGFDPYKIDPEAIVQAFDTTKLVLADEQLSDLISAFAHRYVSAQHSTEYTGMIGGLLFEIVLTAILIFLTAGTGVVASAGSKLKNVDGLKDLGRCLDDFAKLLRKQTKKLDADISQQTAIGKVDTVELEDVEVSPSNPNDSKKQNIEATGREEVVLINHRKGNRQIAVDGSVWNVPEGKDIGDIPVNDSVGDRLQAETDIAAEKWDESQLSINEQLAIAEAEMDGEYWRGNLLKAQAKGRWVENEVRVSTSSMDAIQWSRTGVDVTDLNSGLKYDILSGTKSNMDTHAKRMPNDLFRMIKF